MNQKAIKKLSFAGAPPPGVLKPSARVGKVTASGTFVEYDEFGEPLDDDEFSTGHTLIGATVC